MIVFGYNPTNWENTTFNNLPIVKKHQPTYEIHHLHTIRPLLLLAMGLCKSWGACCMKNKLSSFYYAKRNDQSN